MLIVIGGVTVLCYRFHVVGTDYARLLFWCERGR